jgi:agmatine deiminase
VRTPFAEGYAMPAEWEPHSATWLAWPHEESDWPGKLAAVRWVFVEMARVISEGERVRMLVRGAADEREARRLLSLSGVDLGRVDFARANTDRSWTRDYVPLFVRRAVTKRVSA